MDLNPVSIKVDVTKCIHALEELSASLREIKDRLKSLEATMESVKEVSEEWTEEDQKEHEGWLSKRLEERASFLRGLGQARNREFVDGPDLASDAKIVDAPGEDAPGEDDI